MKDIILVIALAFVIMIIIFIYCCLIIANQFDRRYYDWDNKVYKHRNKKD